jgi:NitT/TauT family transport system permease protein
MTVVAEVVPVAVRRRWTDSSLVVAGLQVALIGAVIGAWQLAADHGPLNEFLFSRPSHVWSFLWTWTKDGTLASNLWTTMKVLLEGWGFGVVGGAAIGVALGVNRTVREIFEPFIVFANAVPRLLFLPILIVLFGFGSTPKVILVVLVVIFIVAVTVAAGIREISPDLLLNARMLGARPLDRLRIIYLPAVAIWILTSARTTVGYAVQATIASEFIGSSKGLGTLIIEGDVRLDVGEMFAAITVVFLLGIALDSLLGVIQKRATRWMPRSA